MHFLPRDSHSLDETAEAVDLQQSAADLVFLSFTDSDLALMASAAEASSLKDLRLAHLAQLKHPLSVDLYVDAVLSKAKVIVIRILGGLDYWRYGAEQASLIAERTGARLVIIPGCDKADERLYRLSTVRAEQCDAIWRCFLAGGVRNAARVIAWMQHFGGQGAEPDGAEELARTSASRNGAGSFKAAIVHYRALSAAGDMAGIAALERALHARDISTSTIALASTKDADCAAFLSAELMGFAPDIVINTTSFSARQEDGTSPFDAADAVVLQAIFSNRNAESWQGSTRGIGATDLAMNIAMPELDGRLATRIIAFREDEARHPDFQCALRRLMPMPDRIDWVADQALAFARLRRKPNRDKRLALILNDYPNAGGRAGHAVGLDGPASAQTIATELAAAGFEVADLPVELARAIEQRPILGFLPPSLWKERLKSLPLTAQAGYQQAFEKFGPAGPPIFGIRAGRLVVALQPARSSGDRKVSYHDATLPPVPEYLAFYWWLRDVHKADALIHLGAHGTLEWLPGKAAALSAGCWPEIALGATPVVYPFIVSDPGEAAQAKRRLSAITIGHLTPPMLDAGLFGEAQSLETLLEELGSAADLDPRRARLLEAEILERAERAGLTREIGAEGNTLPAIDAWLCDLKEMRVKDGLHVFGGLSAAAGEALAVNIAEASGLTQEDAERRIHASSTMEMASLVAALEGRFVPPGPSGAPSRGRTDVLPTGRNMTTLDPRQSPTVTAERLGQRAADAILAQHVQDHGEWPKSLVIDAWGSAAIRTGGEEIAQALALMGVRLKRDTGSDRINGFEVLSLAEIGRPRSDITLRISGLYRDLFQYQISLFDAAVQAVARRDEAADDNPLAATARHLDGEAFRFATLRIFGPAPQAYGTGLEAMVLAVEGEDHGSAHARSNGFAYGADLDGRREDAAFRHRLASADGLIHAIDMHEADLLEAPDYAYGIGGFIAASADKPVYILDSRNTAKLTVRPLRQELARTIRSRAANPRWIAGLMRHGHRGAAELAQTMDSVFAFAALGAKLDEHQFDMLHRAYVEDAEVSAFLMRTNPEAQEAIEGRFAELVRRGLWQPRRNSIAMRYAGLTEAA